MNKKEDHEEVENVRSEFVHILKVYFESVCSMNIKLLPLLVPHTVSYLDKTPIDCEELLVRLVYSEESAESLVLLGEGGSGKTSRLVKFTHFIFEEYFNQRTKLVPIFVPLRTVSKDMYEQGESDIVNNFLVNFLDQKVIKGYESDKKTDISNWLLEQDILLVLDGYDELEQRVDENNHHSFPNLLCLLSRFVPAKSLKVIVGTRRSVVDLKHSVEGKDEDSTKASDAFLVSFYSLKNDELQRIKEIDEEEENHEHVTKMQNENQGVKLINLLPLQKKGVFDYLSRFAKHHTIFQKNDNEKVVVFLNEEGVVDEYKYRKIFQEIPSLFALCSNPNMMLMVFKYLPKIYSQLMNENVNNNNTNNDSRKIGKRLELTRLQVFKSVTNAWFEREALRMLEIGVIVGVQNNPMSVRLLSFIMDVYSRNLARKQFERGRMKQTISRKESMNKNLLKGVRKTVFRKLKIVGDEKKTKILEAVRNSCVISIDQDRYMFFHNSIIEYFSFKNCVDEIRGMKEWLFQIGTKRGKEIFFTKFISREMGVLKFMVEKVLECLKECGESRNDILLDKKNTSLLHQMFRIIDLSKEYPELLSIAASNSLSILSRSGVSFSGMDFRMIVARNAVFFESVLDGTDFSLADLTGSRFIRCYFHETKFNGACLRGCQFDSVDNKNSKLYNFSSYNSPKEQQQDQFVKSMKYITLSCVSLCGKYFAYGDINSGVTIMSTITKEEFVSVDVYSDTIKTRKTIESSSSSSTQLSHVDKSRVFRIDGRFYRNGLLLIYIVSKRPIYYSDPEKYCGITNDVLLFDINSGKVVQKYQSHTIIDESSEKMKHCSLRGGKKDILIWCESKHAKGRLCVRNASKALKEDNNVITETIIRGGILMTRCSFDGRRDFIGCPMWIYVFDEHARLISSISLSSKLEDFGTFGLEYLWVLVQGDVIKYQIYRDFRYVAQLVNDHGELERLKRSSGKLVDLYQIQSGNDLRESLVQCFSPTKPLVLMKRLGDEKVLRVVDYSKMELSKDISILGDENSDCVVGVTSNPFYGSDELKKNMKLFFHPNEIQTLFIHELLLSKSSVLKEVKCTLSASMVLHSDETRMGCNKKCLIFNVDNEKTRKREFYALLSPQKALSSNYPPVLLFQTNDFDTHSSHVDSVVPLRKDAGEDVFLISVRIHMLSTIRCKIIWMKHYLTRGRIRRDNVYATKEYQIGYALDSLVIGSKKQQLERVSLNSSGMKICVITKAGDILLWNVFSNRELAKKPKKSGFFSSFKRSFSFNPSSIDSHQVEEEEKKKRPRSSHLRGQQESFRISEVQTILACSKHIPLGMTGKVFGSWLGTLKNLYKAAVSGRRDEIIVLNTVRNRLEFFDYSATITKKKKKSIFKGFRMIPDQEKLAKTVESLKKIRYHEVAGELIYGANEMLSFDYENEILKYENEVDFQFIDGHLRVMSSVAGLGWSMDTVKDGGLELQNVFGISIKNGEYLKKFCKMKMYLPHFGYIDHPAINIDPSKHLEQGDILLKFKNSSEGVKLPLINISLQASNVTQLGYLVDDALSGFLRGEKKFPHNFYRITHACIFCGNEKFIEASKNGIQLKFVDGRDSVPSDFMVFRLKGGKRIAKKVSSFCEEILDKQKRRKKVIEVLSVAKKNITYNTLGAFMSILSTKSDRGKEEYKKIMEGDKQLKDKYFCSELVVHVYHLAAALLNEDRVIGIDSSQAHPKILYERIKKDERWEYIGNIINTTQNEKKKIREEEQEEEQEGEEISEEEEEEEGENEEKKSQGMVREESKTRDLVSSFQKNIKIVENYWRSKMKENRLRKRWMSFLEKEEEKKRRKFINELSRKLPVTRTFELHLQPWEFVLDTEVSFSKEETFQFMGIGWKIEIRREENCISLKIYNTKKGTHVRAIATIGMGNTKFWPRGRTNGKIEFIQKCTGECLFDGSGRGWERFASFRDDVLKNSIEEIMQNINATVNVKLTLHIIEIFEENDRDEVESNQKKKEKELVENITGFLKKNRNYHQKFEKEVTVQSSEYLEFGILNSKFFSLCGLPWKLELHLNGRNREISIFIRSCLREHFVWGNGRISHNEITQKIEFEKESIIRSQQQTFRPMMIHQNDETDVNNVLLEVLGGMKDVNENILEEFEISTKNNTIEEEEDIEIIYSSRKSKNDIILENTKPVHRVFEGFSWGWETFPVFHSDRSKRVWKFKLEMNIVDIIGKDIFSKFINNSKRKQQQQQKIENTGKIEQIEFKGCGGEIKGRILKKQNDFCVFRRDFVLCGLKWAVRIFQQQDRIFSIFLYLNTNGIACDARFSIHLKNLAVARTACDWRFRNYPLSKFNNYSINSSTSCYWGFREIKIPENCKNIFHALDHILLRMKCDKVITVEEDLEERNLMFDKINLFCEEKKWNEIGRWESVEFEYTKIYPLSGKNCSMSYHCEKSIEFKSIGLYFVTEFYPHGTYEEPNNVILELQSTPILYDTIEILADYSLSVLDGKNSVMATNTLFGEKKRKCKFRFPFSSFQTNKEDISQKQRWKFNLDFRLLDIRTII